MKYYPSESGLLRAGRDPSMAQPFSKHSKAHRRQIVDLVISGSGDVKRLKGHGGGCRLRVGDWHFIFIEDARSITVIAVGNRREIYD
jgi:mRNA-degrading endonuclease RelE of RelBE toxin-antitoxin system